MLRKTILLLICFLCIWVSTDLWVPRKHDLRKFNPESVGMLDAKMWRSYYEKKPLLLFWQSAKLFRQQLKAPFWRSFKIAYHAAKAAFIFKDGTNREEYKRALPNLEAFYLAVANLSNRPLDIKQAAAQELEWWIIRRYREDHPPAEWSHLQSQIAAEIYSVPIERCEKYGAIRTNAMLYRDNLGSKILEKDWKKIEWMLGRAWKDLHNNIN